MSSLLQVSRRNEAIAQHYRVINQVERDCTYPKANPAEWRRAVEATADYYADIAHKWAGVTVIDGHRLNLNCGDAKAALTFATAAAHLALTRHPEYRCQDAQPGVVIALYSGSAAFAEALAAINS